MALDWLPTYPSILPTKRSRQSATQTYAYGTLSPIPIPAPPNQLSWHPTYPDYLPPLRRRAYATSFTARWPMVPPITMAWLPSYPTILPHRRLAVADMPSGSWNQGALLEIPKSGGWRPTYPAYLRPKPRLVPGAGVWIVDPTTLLNAAPCVNWADTAVTTPALVQTVTTNPVLSGGVVVRARFTDEAMCDGVLNLAATFLPLFAAGLALSWLPTYPSQFKPRRVTSTFPSFFWRPIP